jgi:adenylate cyclase
MAVEIERKFLVDVDLLPDLLDGSIIKQVYVFIDDDKHMRIRLDDEAKITIKMGSKALCRQEFEYNIPYEDAVDMIEQLSNPLIIDKLRYKLEVAGKEWEIDFFMGANLGLVMAEVELADVNESFVRPGWASKEVTHDQKYLNVNLAKRK